MTRSLRSFCVAALFLLGCVEGMPRVLDDKTPHDLLEYEVVWHKKIGGTNQTQTLWYRQDHEVKEFFANDVIVKITRIEPNGERIVVCSVYDGTACQ